MKTPLRTAILCAALVVATPAMAEVSDKVIHPSGMWLGAVFGIVAGVLVAFVRPWLALIAIPVGLLIGPGQGIATVLDSHVGPAILQEAGSRYAVHAYGSAASVVVANLLVFLRGRRGARSKRAV